MYRYKHVPIYWYEIKHKENNHDSIPTQFFHTGPEDRDKDLEAAMQNCLKRDPDASHWEPVSGEF